MNLEKVFLKLRDLGLEVEEYREKNIVLYFYPKNNTKGCTMEALEFTELAEEFSSNDSLIIGVSRDGEKSHENFKKKHELRLILISDSEEEIHNDFQVMKPKKMYGKEYIGVDRSTFIFDKKGNLIKEFRGVKVSGHAQEVLDHIKNLK